jgi:DNA-directed RNA polymerase subunit RPC12/RpoP
MMNIAIYHCYSCSTEVRKVFEDRPPKTISCEGCGQSVGWKSLIYDIKPVRKFAECSADAMHEDHPRWSSAMGVNPETIPEVHKQFPNLDLTFNPDGDILVKNRQHKKELMKAFKMTEFAGSSWRDFPQSHVLVKRKR